MIVNSPSATSNQPQPIVVVQRSGRLELNGAMTGNATNHGNMQLNGAMTGNATNDGNMLLRGTLVGNVVNEGVLTPAPSTSAHIEGSFSQSPAGTLDAVIAETSGVFVSVWGRANIDGTNLRLT